MSVSAFSAGVGKTCGNILLKQKWKLTGYIKISWMSDRLNVPSLVSNHMNK